MQKTKLIFISNLVFLILVFPSRADYKARIIDANTGKPIEGVVVLFAWHSAFGGSWARSIFDSREVLTDKRGYFAVKNRKTSINPFLVVEDYPELTIFKSGYKPIIAIWHNQDSCKDCFSVVGGQMIFRLEAATLNERLRLLKEGLLVWPDDIQKLLAREVETESELLKIINQNGNNSALSR